MKKLEVVKTVAGVVVSVGVGAIVGNAVGLVAPAATHIVKKVCIGIGGMVITSMISDKAVAYTNTQIDAVVELANLAKTTA